MRFVFFVLLLTIVAVSVSCAPPTSKNIPSGVGVSGIVTPISYGYNVYYFGARGFVFGDSLVEFLNLNEDLEIVTIAPADSWQSTEIIGYFVVFREKEKK